MACGVGAFVIGIFHVMTHAFFKALMFLGAGSVIHGMHHCCNVSCGPEGSASAILLRAGEVVDGLDVGRARRPKSSDRDLARGPGRLCKVLGIDLGDDGLDLRESLRLAPPLDDVSSGPRVGLRLAADRPWRFWITGDPTVSRYVAAKPRVR
jgi:DNA-3-methyladenine glycosylase